MQTNYIVTVPVETHLYRVPKRSDCLDYSKVHPSVKNFLIKQKVATYDEMYVHILGSHPAANRPYVY